MFVSKDDKNSVIKHYTVMDVDVLWKEGLNFYDFVFSSYEQFSLALVRIGDAYTISLYRVQTYLNIFKFGWSS